MGDRISSSTTGDLLSTSIQFVLLFASLIFLVVAKYLNSGIARQRKTNQSENNSEDAACQNERAVPGLEVLPQVQPLFPLLLIGNIPALLPISRTMQKFVGISEKYGDIVKLSGLGRTCVVINSPQLAQTLLKSSEMGHLIKEHSIYDMMRPLITNGVLVSTGKFWQGQRKILMRTQNISSLKASVKILNRHSVKLVDEIEHVFQDGQPHPINEQISSSFLEIINEMITGFDVKSSAEFNEYHRNFQTWKEGVLNRFLNPLLFLNVFWKLHPMSRRNAKAVNEMFEFAKRRIDEHRSRRRLLSSGNSVNGDQTFRSVLDELTDAGVDDRQIVDEMNTMLFGGHETGATAIHFFCFAMSHNPNIQRECQQEIDELFKDKNQEDGEGISYESAQGGLKYLERCILETLRLFPPAFAFIRELSAPLDIEYKGETVRIPVGTAATICPYVLHRREEYYKEALKFNPDRFLPEEQAKRHAYAYLPFSAGPRNCLGLKFAMIEMKVVAAYLLRHFEMETLDGPDDVPLMPYITLTPQRDYIFRFKKRNA